MYLGTAETVMPKCIHVHMSILQIKEAQALKNENKIEKEKNPLLQQLDKKLQSFKVRRQSYYSNAFVGNHVDRCLKVGLKSALQILKLYTQKYKLL